MTITVEQFSDFGLWEEFSETCKHREQDADMGWPLGRQRWCLYTNEDTGGGYGGPCCRTACMGWLDELSPEDRKQVIADEAEQAQQYARENVGGLTE